MKYFEIWLMGSWNNWNNSYICKISLTIPTKAGTSSIIKCNGFSFFVHVWGKFYIHVLKIFKNLVNVGDWKRSQQFIIGRGGAIIRYSRVHVLHMWKLLSWSSITFLNFSRNEGWDFLNTFLTFSGTSWLERVTCLCKALAKRLDFSLDFSTTHVSVTPIS